MILEINLDTPLNWFKFTLLARVLKINLGTCLDYIHFANMTTTLLPWSMNGPLILKRLDYDHALKLQKISPCKPLSATLNEWI